MRARRPGASTIGLLAGAAVGVSIAAILVLTGVLTRPEPTIPNAEEHLLAAWQRYRMATFTLEAEVIRRRDDGAELRSGRKEVQRPPDRVITEHGSFSGRLGGRSINCSLAPDGQQVCGAEGPVLPSWDEEVQTELTNLEAWISGAARAYAVTEHRDGCFELELRHIVLEPPYGQRATLCFDDATGALSSIERQLEGGMVETTESLFISPSVDPRDLSVDLDPDDAPQAFNTVPPGTRPLTTAERLAIETAALDPDAFFERVGDASTDAQIDAIVTDAVRRIEAGEIGINDSRWYDPDGDPYPVLPRLLRALIERDHLPPAVPN